MGYELLTGGLIKYAAVFFIGLGLFAFILHITGGLSYLYDKFCLSNPQWCGLEEEESPYTEISRQSATTVSEAMSEVMEGPPIEEADADNVCKQRGYEFCKPSEGMYCPDKSIMEEYKTGNTVKFVCCAPGDCAPRPGFNGVTGSVIAFADNDLGDSLLGSLPEAMEHTFKDTTYTTEEHGGKYLEIMYEEDYPWIGYKSDNLWFWFNGHEWQFKSYDLARRTGDDKYEDYQPLESLPDDIFGKLDNAPKDIITALKKPENKNSYRNGIRVIASVLDNGAKYENDDWIRIWIDGKDNIKVEHDDPIYCLNDIAGDYNNLDYIQYDEDDPLGVADVYYVFQDGKWKWKDSRDGDAKELAYYRGYRRSHGNDPAFDYLAERLLKANSKKNPEYRYKKGLDFFEDAVNYFDDDHLWIHFKNEVELFGEQTNVYPGDGAKHKKTYCLEKLADYYPPYSNAKVRNFQLPQVVTNAEDWVIFNGDPKYLFYWQNFPMEQDTWTFKGDWKLAAGLIILTSIPPIKALKHVKAGAKFIPKLTSRIASEAAERALLKEVAEEAVESWVKRGLPRKTAQEVVENSILKSPSLTKGLYMYIKKVVIGEKLHKRILERLIKKGASRFIVKGMIVSGSVYALRLAESMTEVRVSDRNGNAIVTAMAKEYDPISRTEMSDDGKGRPVLIIWDPGPLGGVMSVERRTDMHLVSPCYINTMNVKRLIIECYTYSYNSETKITTCKAKDNKTKLGISWNLKDTEPSCLLDMSTVSGYYQNYDWGPERNMRDIEVISKTPVNDVISRIYRERKYEVEQLDENDDDITDRLKISFPTGVKTLVDSDYDGYFETYAAEKCKIDGIAITDIKKNNDIDGHNYCFDERGGWIKFLEGTGIFVAIGGFIVSGFVSGGSTWVAGAIMVASSLIGGAMELEALHEEWEGHWPGPD